MADSVRISQLELIDRLTIDDIIVVNNENVNTNSIKFSNVVNSIQEYPALNFQGSVVFSGNVSLPATTVLNKALGDLTDVTLLNPAADQLVRYNGVTWTNVNVSDLDFQMNIDGLLDVVVLNPTANQILVYNGASWTNLDNPSYTKAEADAVSNTKLGFTDVSVVAAPAVDGGALAYNNTSGEFTFAPDSNENSAKAADVNTLIGVNAGDTNLGTFNGVTISDNSSVKVALQELETAVQAAGGAAGIALTDISVGVPGVPAAQGGLAYDNTNGVFTFTPPDSYTKSEADNKYLGGLTVSTLAASGGGTLAYSNGTLSFAPCDTSVLAAANTVYTKGEVDGFIADVTVNTALTGTPTAPTAGAGTNSTQVATTAYADAAVAAAASAYTPAATGTANNNAIDNLIAALVAIGTADGDIAATNAALAALVRNDT